MNRTAVHRTFWLAQFAAALLLLAASAWADDGLESISLDSFPRDRLQIATPGMRVHTFNIWIAATNPHRMRGLMFVKSLPEDAGMLFLYGSPQPASMWMKNTLIPLDMLFIRGDGRIVHIAANTKPHSLDPISAGQNVTAVLELKGGQSAKLGIQPGAIVMHPAFGNAKK
jgi:uncharacterized membrane protein (UPF0127 family)